MKQGKSPFDILNDMPEDERAYIRWKKVIESKREQKATGDREVKPTPNREIKS